MSDFDGLLETPSAGARIGMGTGKTTTGSTTAVPSPIPLIRHGRRLIGFAVVVMLIGAAAFAAGHFLRLPAEAALKNADASIEVWAKTDERVVYEGFSLPAAVGAASQVDIVVTAASPYGTTPLTASVAPPENGATSNDTAPPATETKPAMDLSTADRVVVSAAGVTAGITLAYGSVLAEVSGRPVFAWPTTSPLYRDLVDGMTGSDVRGVQGVLKQLGHLDAEPDGVFGAQTLQALTDLYAQAGFELPVIRGALRGLSWREFAAIPELPARVISAAPTGSVLTADRPLLSVRSQTPTLTATASVRDIDELHPGAEVGVSVSGQAPVKSTVASIGEFTTDEKSNLSGYPLAIVYPAELGALPPGTSVVLRRWNDAPPTLAVPSTAIRQDATGAYVLIRGPKTDEGAMQKYARVAVQVTAQADGWVALGSASALSTGTDVLVSEPGADG